MTDSSYGPQPQPMIANAGIGVQPVAFAAPSAAQFVPGVGGAEVSPGLTQAQASANDDAVLGQMLAGIPDGPMAAAGPVPYGQAPTQMPPAQMAAVGPVGMAGFIPGMEGTPPVAPQGAQLPPTLQQQPLLPTSAYAQQVPGAQQGYQQVQRPDGTLLEAQPPQYPGQPQQPQQPQQVQQPVADADFAHAMANLRRDGWQTEHLATLPPQVVVQMGTVRGKVQGDMDSAYSELVEFRNGSGLTPGERTGDARTTQRPPESNGVDPQAAAIAAYAQRHGLDEAAAANLTNFVSTQTAPMQTEIQAQNDRLAQTAATSEATAKSLLKLEARNSRGELADRFPVLRDPASYQRVMTRMDRMMDTPGSAYADVSTLMEDATVLEFGQQMAMQARQTLQTARVQGQPMPVTDVQAPPAPRVSMDQMQSSVLDMLESQAPDRYQQAVVMGGYQTR